MKALVTFKYKDDEFKCLRNLGYDIVFKDERDLTFSHDIEDIDMMICSNPFDKIDIDMLPKLKWIQLLIAGVNRVPVEKALRRDIIVTNHRGGYSIPIAEWIVLKTLEMYKNSREYHEKQAAKVWKVDTSILEVHGKTVGFIGTGSIAQETAKRFKAFGMNIIGINSNGRSVKYFDQCFGINRINEVINQWDIVVVTTPYTEDTHHLVDETVFAHMKDASYFINIARGSIVDEDALIDNLKSGKIKKAALDVFEVEPLPKDSPLWDMENVLISPHNSWASEMNHQRRYEIAYKNMERYINGEKLLNVIDLKKGY